MLTTNKQIDQAGAVNLLLFPLILITLLFIGAGCFGIWAFQGKQDYKNNSDQKSAVAVTAALKVEDSKKDAQFAEEAKNPLKTFIGPESYGSLHITYPKTWSAYVDESGASNVALDAYFYPDFVPSITGGTTSYALRAQILNQSYSDSLQGFTDQVQNGTLTVSPYVLSKLKSIVGAKVDGTLSNNKIGSLVLFPLRDKTVEVWTEAAQFQNDFNTNILPNLVFSP